ncbi:M23 family metallopeptidase [Streptomyces sp. WAC 00631]|uniref:M23 family metallopeptidase n=1 Tax=unclassified Streptomyces TaxID=2593676 RepID=UPI001E347A10|nr:MULTISPECIES: M23 family metallopeptidase [unclassified Streptomyces]MCC5036653.1 M23 family metallopeptidase [Streptomyces sp. WAC 00631]MCC9738205.1 M23 family metallopeptidase [Streptomyces sp. MNU89]
MFKHAQILTDMTPLRRRAAFMAAGVGATAVLGTGVALGTQGETENPATGTTATEAADSRAASEAVTAQAEAQKKAAEGKAAAEAAAAERAGQEAADRSKRQTVTQAAAKAPASWVKPVDSYVKGSTFGIGGDRWANKHSGQDFAAPTGTSVKTVHQGTVVQAGWGGAYGNNIVVKHDAGTFTQYAHLSKITVPVGTQVTTGQEIGKVGSTGNSTGPHLHFETRTTPNYGSGIDPVAFLKQRGVTL